MAILGAALLALATQCGGPDAPLELLQRIIAHESAGDPNATHLNKDGSTDYGLAQLNSRNLGWLGLTPATALDPCLNIAGAVRILRALSAYNTGSPTKGLSYAEAAWNSRQAISAPVVPPHPHNQFVVLSGK